jgi:hypothetical protein
VFARCDPLPASSLFFTANGPNSSIEKKTSSLFSSERKTEDKQLISLPDDNWTENSCCVAVRSRRRDFSHARFRSWISGHVERHGSVFTTSAGIDRQRFWERTGYTAPKQLSRVRGSK